MLDFNIGVAECDYNDAFKEYISLTCVPDACSAGCIDCDGFVVSNNSLFTA